MKTECATLHRKSSLIWHLRIKQNHRGWAGVYVEKECYKQWGKTSSRALTEVRVHDLERR